MSLRVRGMEHHDPLSVPLPNGTEVTTRVDRSVGSVAFRPARSDASSPSAMRPTTCRSSGLALRPMRVASYCRERRDSSALRVRRAADWEALRPCVVLEATVGSQAWGLAEAHSDTDVRGAFVLPFTWMGGLARAAAGSRQRRWQRTFWEVEKLIRQALRADPNTLELLFIDGARRRIRSASGCSRRATPSCRSCCTARSGDTRCRS